MQQWLKQEEAVPESPCLVISDDNRHIYSHPGLYLPLQCYFFSSDIQKKLLPAIVIMLTQILSNLKLPTRLDASEGNWDNVFLCDTY